MPHFICKEWFSILENSVHNGLGPHKEKFKKESKWQGEGYVSSLLLWASPPLLSAGVVCPGCLVQVWFHIEHRALVSVVWYGPVGRGGPACFCVSLGHYEGTSFYWGCERLSHTGAAGVLVTEVCDDMRARLTVPGYQWEMTDYVVIVQVFIVLCF